ncbi:MAG: PQQ-binding-like beta-propeller repeat protein [Gemmataceae bacterium]
MNARIVALGLTLCAGASTGRAEDWPQWMGTQRDNIWREPGLMESLPAGGPKVLWRMPIKGGYAGPAVSGGKVFATDYASANQTPEQLASGNFNRKGSNGTERVIAFDEATGKQLWTYEYPVAYTVSYPSGPRCTPLVHDGKVYTLGSEGHLACLNVADGAKIWAKELKLTYQTKSALWGYAAHPMIDGKKLITLAGGEGSHVIALNKDTGEELWKSQSQPEQGYSPPLLTEAGGVRQLIVPGPTAVRSLDPETGKRLWSADYDASNGSIIMTPVRSGEYVFVGGYQTKNILLKLKSDAPEAETVWRNKKNHGLSPVNVQPFLDGTTLYGYDESGNFHAVELPSGKRLWTSGGPVGEDAKGSGTAFIVKLGADKGNRYIFFTETGDLVLGELTTTGYKETSRAHVIDATNTAFGRKVVWCAPAFANKHVYVRNDKEIIALDLAK